MCHSQKRKVNIEILYQYTQDVQSDKKVEYDKWYRESETLSTKLPATRSSITMTSAIEHLYSIKRQIEKISKHKQRIKFIICETMDLIAREMSKKTRSLP